MRNTWGKTGIVVAQVLVNHLTDELPNYRRANSSITHNPMGLQAKSVLYTREISTDNSTCVYTYAHRVRLSLSDTMTLNVE